MKLLRLKINNSFRSLPAGFEIVFRNHKEDLEKNLNEPICLVGVNGSGKSNVLEALAEIFSYIDQTFLRYVLAHSDSPLINSFELEYLLFYTFDRSNIRTVELVNFDTKYIHIKLIKEFDTPTQFYLISNGIENQIIDNFSFALPDRVIGYSSGQNELLSIPFYRVRFRYYNTLLQEQKTTYREAVEYSRLKYIDYDENANILLSNYLMAKTGEVEILKERLQVSDISYFEFIINENQPKRGVLKIEKDIVKVLTFLKTISTSKIESESGILKLCFKVTDELKEEFQSYFLDSAGLYTLLKRFGYLNINSIKKEKIDSLLTSKKEVYENYKIVDFAPDKKLFQISGISIKKSNIDYPISYRNLSDGEHQFIHIIGTLMMMKEESVLFLFDEPETHFNPQWKYEYTETFKKVTNSSKSQILLTTHDPVLISGLAKENVIVFNKPEEGSERIFKPKKDLKGMGVDAILMSEIFGFDTTIDIDTKQEIVELRTLQIKKESSLLNFDEHSRYIALYEKLKGIDFAEPMNDPMFRDFMMAKESLSIYSKPFLSEQEELEREKVSKMILEKIREKFNQ